MAKASPARGEGEDAGWVLRVGVGAEGWGSRWRAVAMPTVLAAQVEHKVELALGLDLVVHPLGPQVERRVLAFGRRVDLHHEPCGHERGRRRA
eukprot:scaffold86386_cov75-Phaeocystis_antarctica.AAC.9